jgi:hypothetical protein
MNHDAVIATQETAEWCSSLGVCVECRRIRYGRVPSFRCQQRARLDEFAHGCQNASRIPHLSPLVGSAFEDPSRQDT